MDWCTYFKCKANRTFDEQLAKLKHHVEGFNPFEIATHIVNGRTVRGVLYHKISRPGEPDWLAFIADFIGQDLREGGLSKHHSAIMLVELDGRVYALAYGMAHGLAKRLTVERKFGKIVVSNGKLTDEVRGIKANVTGPYGKTRIERRGRGGPTRVLEVPRNAGMLGGVAAKLNLGVEHVADGGVGIRTISPTDEPHMISIIDQLEAWWNSGNEADLVLASYDRLEQVRDNDLIDTLNTHLLAAIGQGQSVHFSLALDADELWEATSHEYLINRERLAVPLETTHLVLALKNATDQGMDPFRIHLRSTVPPQSVERDTLLIDNLAFELPAPLNGKTYVFESGVWFQASANWVSKLSGDMNILSASQAKAQTALGIPTFNASHGDENGYIDEVCKQLGDRAIKGHLVFPKHHPILELCDILVDGKYLLFVKKGCDNGACAEVGIQARQTANAILDEPSFATWAQTALFTPRGWKADFSVRTNYTFVLVLITPSPSRVPNQLTVRAQDALSLFYGEIDKFAFKTTVLAV